MCRQPDDRKSFIIRVILGNMIIVVSMIVINDYHSKSQIWYLVLAIYDWLCLFHLLSTLWSIQYHIYNNEDALQQKYIKNAGVFRLREHQPFWILILGSLKSDWHWIPRFEDWQYTGAWFKGHESANTCRGLTLYWPRSTRGYDVVSSYDHISYELSIRMVYFGTFKEYHDEHADMLMTIFPNFSYEALSE